MAGLEVLRGLMVTKCIECRTCITRKLSELRRSKHQYCSKECNLIHKKSIYDLDRRVNRFVKSTWANLNIRCGKYRHLQTKNKCKSYINISIKSTRKEFRDWCFSKRFEIETFERPSLDRVDSSKDYSLDNIQILELADNISKKTAGNKYLNGPKYRTKRGIRKAHNGKYSARISYSGKETYLGTFDTEESAYEAFKVAYLKHYGVCPW